MKINAATIKGIIFDFDGTLFDMSFIEPRLILENPRNLPYILKERTVRRYFAGKDSSSSEEYYKSFFERLGKTSPQSPEFWRNWFFTVYMPQMIRVLAKYYKPRANSIELIRFLLDSDHKIAVYSDYPMLKERMEAIGFPIHEKLKLYGQDSFGAQKPAVRPFLQIARDFGLPSEEILVVGDRRNRDGKGAFYAKMPYFHVKNRNWQNLVTAFKENGIIKVN